MRLSTRRRPARWLGRAQHFSDPPTDTEILVSGVLPQPLAPTRNTAANENRALAAALTAYLQSGRDGAAPDMVEPLTGFLRAHPGSAWEAALDLSLGLIYRRTGHMSQTMEAWQRAWDLSKHATDPKARAIADYSVGQLAEFEAYLGRMELLVPLLDEVKGRQIHGTGATNIFNARQALAEMHSHPELSFRCGPMAVRRISLSEGHIEKAAQLERAYSTSRGTSLTKVAELARKAGLDFRMAYREPGAAILAPAVMHWRLGHFAAITKDRGGVYQIEDPTFGENIVVGRATIDDEASGYFVVPRGPLPHGWRAVSASEGDRIWGRGFTSVNDQTATCPCDKRAFPASGTGDTLVGVSPAPMTTANVEAMVVSLALHDVPLSYQPPKGPAVSFELFYSHLDAEQPAMFVYTNFGPKWTSNWISYFADNTAYGTGTADLYTPGGGQYSYNFSGSTFAPGTYDQALVSKIISGGQTAGFTREMPDASVQTFAHQFGTTQFFFLSAISDPQGNTVTLTYDGNNRITSITDAAGEVTTLAYGLASDIWKVTRVTDPFGRSATFTYNSDGELTSITDLLGLTSSYTYQATAGDFISTLVTPYGTTSFTYADQGDDYTGPWRIVTITDPLGQTERAEFREADEYFGISVPGISDSDPAYTLPMGMNIADYGLSHRNTFVWDKHQLALATNQDGSVDYTKATILHFLISTANDTETSRTLESIKPPLENRIWFNYPNQQASFLEGSSSLPTKIGRVLVNDGSNTTQLLTLQYNSFGQMTQLTDPIGRQLTMTYAPDGIDLLSIANTTKGANQRLFGAVYNNQHEPLTMTDAAGQVATFTYNAAGQVLTATDPLNENTSFMYSPAGFCCPSSSRSTTSPPISLTTVSTACSRPPIRRATHSVSATTTPTAPPVSRTRTTRLRSSAT